MCNHISIVLPNRPGELSRLTNMLAEQGVNILGHQSETQGSSATVHVLCDSHEVAFEKLRSVYRFYCNQKKVIIISVSNVPGALSTVLQHLASSDLNLESSYQASLKGQLLLVFELKDRKATDDAENVLLNAGFSVLRKQPCISEQSV